SERWFPMLLRHATPLRNLPGIQRRGLLCAKSQGKLQVVWLHAPTETSWAILHTVKRHGGRVEGVLILEVNVPRRWLRRSRKGLWYCPRDTPPERFGRLIAFAELAGPSADNPAQRPQQRPTFRLVGGFEGTEAEQGRGSPFRFDSSPITEDQPMFEKSDLIHSYCRAQAIADAVL